MSAAARLQGLGGPRKLGEREYTDDDVRKGLRYIQAAVDTGGAAPTGYAVAQLLKLPSSERAIKRGWAEVLKYPGDDAAQRAARIDSYVAPAWGGAREESIIFTEDEEAMLQTAVDIAAEGGFGVSVEYVRELMRDVLAAPDREIKSARRDVSKTTVKAWMKKRSIRRYKTNSIDPARVAKATEEVRDKWFARVDSCAAPPALSPLPCRRGADSAPRRRRPRCAPRLASPLQKVPKEFDVDDVSKIKLHTSTSPLFQSPLSALCLSYYDYVQSGGHARRP